MAIPAPDARLGCTLNGHIVCLNVVSMLSCPLMFGPSAPARMHYRALPVLHLLMAGLFALVLPFICWGAEITPGHPHSRAHFVFMAPTLVRPDAHTVTQAAAEMMATAPEHIACISAILTEGAGAATSDVPAGQSVPLVLAITMLLLAAFALGVAPVPAGKGGFARAVTGVTALSWPLPIATPPPR